MTAIVTVGACAIPAAAHASSRPTLNGEQLSAAPNIDAPPYPFFLGLCGEGANSKTDSDFSFSGTASGPYPGTFTESGTVKYVGYPAPPDNQGPVTRYAAVFRIRSQNVMVTGRETLVRTGASANCFGGVGGAGVTIGPVTTRYRAAIVTPTRRYHDHGTSQATLGQSLGLGQYWSGHLSDQFTSRRARG